MKNFYVCLVFALLGGLENSVYASRGKEFRSLCRFVEKLIKIPDYNEEYDAFRLTERLVRFVDPELHEKSRVQAMRRVVAGKGSWRNKKLKHDILVLAACSGNEAELQSWFNKAYREIDEE